MLYLPCDNVRFKYCCRKKTEQGRERKKFQGCPNSQIQPKSAYVLTLDNFSLQHLPVCLHVVVELKYAASATHLYLNLQLVLVYSHGVMGWLFEAFSRTEECVTFYFGVHLYLGHFLCYAA